MSKRILFLIIIILHIAYSKAQIPPNLVPNADFEEGSDPTPCGCKTVSDFDNKIDYWKAALESTNCYDWMPDCKQGTPDWQKREPTPPACQYHCDPDHFQGKRWVGLAGGTVGEGVRVQLNYALENGKDYLFRIKAAGQRNAALRVHFTKWNKHWNDDDPDNKRIWNAANVFIPDYSGVPHADGCTVWSLQRSFKVDKDGLGNIVLFKGEFDYINIDDVEVFEYCPTWMYRQNRKYYYVEELEEAGTIVAGSNVVSDYPVGEVHLYNGSKTTYKASDTVILMPGFVVDQGASFTIKMADCGSECINVYADMPKTYTLCGDNSIQIGTNSKPTLIYKWEAINPGQIGYLSATNIANPVFRLPTGNATQYPYKLTVSNPCGEILVLYTTVINGAHSDPNPIFTIGNQKIINQSRPQFTIGSLSPNTEKVQVLLLDCNNTLLETNEYVNTVDFNCCIFDWQLANPKTCGCYKIKVRSKNYCFDNWYEQTMNWDNNPPLSDVVVPNVINCVNGIRMYCVNATGASGVHVEVRNNWGTLVCNKQGVFTDHSFCVELPRDLPAGVYYGIVDIIPCVGTVQSTNTTIYVPDCNGDAPPETTDSINPEGNNNLVYVLDDGSIDSLYITLQPNPVTDQATLSYHIPKGGNVKLTLYDATMQTVQTLVDNIQQAPGDYQVPFGNAALLTGSCYYRIELVNERYAYVVKQFLVIH